MLRRSIAFFTSLGHLTDRLDSLEKEVIDLKAFRSAVERTSPEVATRAKELVRRHVKEYKESEENIKDPLSADEFAELNQFFAAQKAKKIELDNLMYMTTVNDLIAAAALFRREYLVRISLRVKALTTAPYGLSQMPSFQELKRWYQWSFHDVRSTPAPKTREECIQFDKLVRRIFLRHYNVSNLLIEGMYELAHREQWKWADLNDSILQNYNEVEQFFSNFCHARARLRFLVGHYMYLSTKILNVDACQVKDSDSDGETLPLFFDHPPEEFVGFICKKTSLMKLLQCVIRSAKTEYDEDIELSIAGDADITFTGIPYITFDIIAALIHDAITANLQRQELLGIPCEKIIVTVAQKKENQCFTVRVSDTAGGLPLATADLSLTYWSTLRSLNSDYENPRKIDTWIHSPIGLPYANCVVQVLGGKAAVVSIEGYGTDRQLYLPASGIHGISV